MRLENQLAPVELCLKLQKLGIAQEGIFSWLYEWQSGCHKISQLKVEALELLAKANPEDTKWGHRIEQGVCSAFSVAEIGVMLPAMVDECKLTQWPIYNDITGAIISYGMQYRYKSSNPVNYGVFPLHCVFGSTEAKARAEILICLLADKKVTPEECNKRLLEA